MPNDEKPLIPTPPTIKDEPSSTSKAGESPSPTDKADKADKTAPRRRTRKSEDAPKATNESTGVYPTEIYAARGWEIGSDGDRKRYSLSGKPLN